MSELNLPVVDKTVHKTRLWLDDIMCALETTDRLRAYRALRAVLHAVRDLLPIEQMAHFSAQLPVLVRGVFFEGWRPSITPTNERHVDQFLARIALEFGDYPTIDLERVARQVMRVFDAHLSDGVVDDVVDCLPTEIREFLVARIYRTPGTPTVAAPA